MTILHKNLILLTFCDDAAKAHIHKYLKYINNYILLLPLNALKLPCRDKFYHCKAIPTIIINHNAYIHVLFILAETYCVLYV